MVAHRLLLGLELLVLAVPVTLLFVLAVPEYLGVSDESCGLVLPTGRFVLCLVAGAALLSVWYLSVRFIVSGRITGERVRPAPWIAMLAGLLVACATWVEHYFPFGNPYGCLDVFRVAARPFGFGVVLLVPMIHLAWLKYGAHRSRRASG
jgi:hypothetical protein